MSKLKRVCGLATVTTMLLLSHGSPANAQSVSIAIATTLPTVGVGMPVIVTATMTNVSTAALTVTDPATYAVSVKDSSGNPVKLTPAAQAARSRGLSSSSLLVQLQPGTPNTQTIIVSAQYDLSAPGTYTVQLSGGLESSTLMPPATSNVLTISVKGGPRGDLNGDGIVDLQDLAILQAAMNNPALKDPLTNAVNDARDLNSDGVINTQDARILTTLCTYPRCASHP